jgi:hypothetical protein
MRSWKYVGQYAEDEVKSKHSSIVRCMIIAPDEARAIFVANKTFKTPLTSPELSVMWKPIDVEMMSEIQALGVDVSQPGVWEVRNDKWTKR